ncbi:alkaline phosphatase family protein [Sphingomonas sp. SUN039]|uniref:alkaline phosphatase family protein n=1 Tax=Sphingomonas sp. SUN039 TaxID=2937787 RepID=UPI0021640F15|nr:alkaline phosphatase family protein [Sphingomonas sp. SUN039]UVO54870.1 alkaline phosphatase family protein [Sphingomonas sp. SUN039]
MIRRLVVLALAALPVGLLAQSPPPPKLIVAISVDQFSADLFAEYRGHFTGGLKRLSGGVVFPSGYQSHAATETCPGHSTILTGSHPSRTGIVANGWVDQTITSRPDSNVYCAEDVSKGRSSSSKDYVPSPVTLMVPTLGDRMKAINPASRVVAVAGKDRAAIMMGGHRTDQIWFLNPRDYARFETLSDHLSPPPAAVARANAAIDAALARPMRPMPLSPLCAAHSRTIAINATKSVGEGRFARPAGDKRLFRASPEADTATVMLAGDLIDDLKLGRGAATDLIAIGVSSTDTVGHVYGTEGSEMCLQLMALDAQLGKLFARLDRARIDYAVVLTADHGGHDVVERNVQNALPEAARVDDSLTAKGVGTLVATELGLSRPALMGSESAGDFWLDASIPADKKAPALARSRALFLASSQVQAVFTAAEIEATAPASGPPETWTLIERARSSYYKGRSGDLVVVLKPRITPISARVAGGPYTATHGSPWDYDRRVPMLFWRKGLMPYEQPNSVETVDILPTLAALIGLTVPKAEIDGRCLDLIAGPASSCPAN